MRQSLGFWSLLSIFNIYFNYASFIMDIASFMAMTQEAQMQRQKEIFRRSWSQTFDMKKEKVLYLDDEEPNLDLFSDVLNERFEVITAPDGVQGLSILNDNPDIYAVIADMNMPEMTGLEFIKKAQVEKKGIEYYILTGYEISRELEEALSDGIIKNYFQKPFNLLKIRDEILSN